MVTKRIVGRAQARACWKEGKRRWLGEVWGTACGGSREQAPPALLLSPSRPPVSSPSTPAPGLRGRHPFPASVAITLLLPSSPTVPPGHLRHKLAAWRRASHDPLRAAAQVHLAAPRRQGGAGPRQPDGQARRLLGPYRHHRRPKSSHRRGWRPALHRARPDLPGGGDALQHQPAPGGGAETMLLFWSWLLLLSSPRPPSRPFPSSPCSLRSWSTTAPFSCRARGTSSGPTARGSTSELLRCRSICRKAIRSRGTSRTATLSCEQRAGKKVGGC